MFEAAIVAANCDGVAELTSVGHILVVDQLSTAGMRFGNKNIIKDALSLLNHSGSMTCLASETNQYTLII